MQVSAVFKWEKNPLLFVRTVNLLKAKFIRRPVPSLGIRLMSEPLDR